MTNYAVMSDFNTELFISKQWAAARTHRGVAGRSFPGRQEVVAFDNLWVAFEELPMALGSMINSPMVSST